MADDAQPLRPQPLPDPDEPNPVEEVGPQEAEARAERTEMKAGALDGPAQESQYTVSDMLGEQFPLEPIMLAPHPIDGLPAPIDEPTQFMEAPPFRYETVICVEDDRQWVELFDKEQDDRGYVPPPSKSGYALEFRDAHMDDGKPRERRVFAEGSVRFLWDKAFVATGDQGPDGRRLLLPVRPLRERCKHYTRQLFGNDDQPDPNQPGNKILFRNCHAKRSVGGAFLSLRDEAVFACDLRSPPDPVTSAKMLDGPDRQRLRNADDVVRLPLFGERSQPKLVATSAISPYPPPSEPAAQPADEPKPSE